MAKTPIIKDLLAKATAEVMAPVLIKAALEQLIKRIDGGEDTKQPRTSTHRDK